MNLGAEMRRVYPRVLARTMAFTRNLADAEDAVQEAVLRGLDRWTRGEVPESIEAWLVRVATNAHRDRLRKGKREAPPVALERLARMSPWASMIVAEPTVARGWKDELLRLLFACCHPALERGESAALCLATIIGMPNHEVAMAFTVERRTMEQRLNRARQRLRERGEVEVGSPEQSSERLSSVLCVIHLLFNEGYWSSDPSTPIRAHLCQLALGLARSLLEAFPGEAEVGGLLALLTMHEARRVARRSEAVDGQRTDGQARFLSLREQDRGRWDHDAIEGARSLLNRCAHLARPGAFQIEAAIAYEHCRAKTASATQWGAIAILYDALERYRETPAVRVNRAFAHGQAYGPAAGLALLDSGAQAVRAYPYCALVQANLLLESGDLDGARVHFKRALGRARNTAEREQIEAQLSALTGP